jgi:hypothetical protein
MRPTEQTAPNRSAPNGNGRTEVAYALGSQVVADPGGSRILDEGDARSSEAKVPLGRWVVIGLVVTAVLRAELSFGAPYVTRSSPATSRR